MGDHTPDDDVDDSPTGDDEHDDGTPVDERTDIEAAAEERRRAYPDVGYNVVEIDKLDPPGEALTPHRHKHTLKLSELSLPKETDLNDWVIYDSTGTAYDQDDLHAIPDRVDPDGVDELVETVQSSEGKPRRLALVRLAGLADEQPGACVGTVPALTTLLRSSPAAVRAEGLGILEAIAEETPERVLPAVDAVVALLDPGVHPAVRDEAARVVARVAEHDSEAVRDAVPKLATLLQDEETTESAAVTTTCAYVADATPEAVVPVASQLVSFLESGDDIPRIGALATLGRISKEYPNVAVDAVPAVVELLDADHYRVRANASGLLADLADQYPGEVRSVAPQAIELLDDDDEKVQYNATSILARIASVHPDPVEPATDRLVELLDAEFSPTRVNACWALGYLEADRALDDLEVRAANDPEEEVRNAAAAAVRKIRG